MEVFLLCTFRNPIRIMNHWPLKRKETFNKAMYSLEPLLKVENLKTWFPVQWWNFLHNKGFQKAVDDVVLMFSRGETLGLVGESGCGKTTLGRSILRLIEPNEGELYFENKNLISLEGKELRKMRKRMQIIFQDPYVSLESARMTVGEAILEPMTVHGLYTDENTRKKSCRVVGAREFEAGTRETLSLWIQRRAASTNLYCESIGFWTGFYYLWWMCFCAGCEYPGSGAEFVKWSETWFRFHIHFISHDLSVVKYMSDRMMVMHNGK